MPLSTFKRLTFENAILALGALLIIADIFFILVHGYTKLNYHMPYYYEPGYQFAGFKDKLAGQKEIGYLTNKDLSAGKNDGVYLQAQYFLAPTILKLNAEGYTYNILDYSNQIFVFYMIKELHAAHLADNAYGQVLIKNKTP